MAQPPRNDVRSHDWSMAIVGGFITLIIAALFFRQLTVEICTTLLYWLWNIADFPRTHTYATWRINLLARTHNNAPDVTWSEFFDVLDVTASILMIVFIPLMMTGIIVVRRHQASRTRRDISIHTLPRIMSAFSPSIIPALTYGDKKQQLLNVDPEEHRSAQTPDEFAIEHKLVVNQHLRRDVAQNLFITQLGTPLPKVAISDNVTILFEAFNDHEQAMFAIFGLQYFLDKRKEAEALLDALNRSTLKTDRRYRNKIGYPNLSLAKSAFKKVIATEQAQGFIRQYGYIRTAISALHDNDLHLPIRRFRWLKGLDRTLWYTLASTGRPWPFVEAAGVVSQAHWETLAARYRIRLPHPIMSLALDGLEDDLRNIGAVVDDSPRPTRASVKEENDIDDDDEDVAHEDNPTQEARTHRHTHSFRPKMR